LREVRGTFGGLRWVWMTEVMVAAPSRVHVGAMSIRPRRLVAPWLWACTVAVACLGVLGGFVRLERAGLSITEWAPVAGVLLPADQASWDETFAAYSRIGEARTVHAGISLQTYQRLFLLEWAHRLAGRLVAAFCLVPLAFFVWKKQLSPREIRWLALTGAGFAAQGALGWWMVKSGLGELPHVSPLRLSLHLGGAIVMLSLLATLAARRAAEAVPCDGRSRRLVGMALGCVIATMLAGALVAGNRAGPVAPTFPLINGALVPPNLLALSPSIRNLVENPIATQFLHRVLAAGSIVVVAALAHTARVPRRSLAGTALRIVLAATAAQWLLGATVVVFRVPEALALLHQGNALLLVSALAVLRASTSTAPASGPRPAIRQRATDEGVVRGGEAGKTESGSAFDVLRSRA
jgi:heme a synthase